jgi:type IV pilus assembly protein PilN
MIKVNLLAYREEREKIGTLSFLMTSAGIFLLFIFLLLLIWFRQNNRIDSLQNKKVTLQRDLDSLQAIIKESKEIKNKVKILEGKVQAIDLLKKNQQGPVRLLDELNQKLADDVWLDSLTEEDSQFTIQGNAFTNEGIAIFMKNLARSNHFQDVELVQSIQTTSMEEDIYGFTLTFRWGSAPAPPTEEKDKEQK